MPIVSTLSIVSTCLCLTALVQFSCLFPMRYILTAKVDSSLFLTSFLSRISFADETATMKISIAAINQGKKKKKNSKCTIRRQFFTPKTRESIIKNRIKDYFSYLVISFVTIVYNVWIRRHRYTTNFIPG